MRKLTALFIIFVFSFTTLFGCGFVPSNSDQEINNGINDNDETTNSQDNQNPSIEKNPDDAPQKENQDSEDEKVPENEPPHDSEEDKTPADENTNDPSNDPITPDRPPVGTAVGNSFRDLTLTTLSGESISTADLRGKIVIFNVWATWCGPCMQELPDFNIIASEYADDVVIIAAHIYDNSAANMPSYVASNFPDTKIIFAYDNANNEGYFAAGGIGYVPQTAIIDEDGVIIYSDSGMLSYEFIVEIIEKNRPSDTIPEEDEKEDEGEKPEIPYGTSVGTRFKNITLTTLSGESISTSDLRGKIVIFNVWATWCGPCMQELPDFNIIASEYADDVVIIAAHLYDNYADNMPSYVASNFPDTQIIFAYDNAYDEGYYAAGGYGYVPQTAIIDKDGVIIYTDAGALSYEFLVEIIEANK